MMRPRQAKLRLPLEIDPIAIARDLRALEDHVRSSPGPFETKGWEGIALIQGDGRDDVRSPLPSESGPQPTAALARCPVLKDLLLNRLPAPILVARLLYLEPGGSAGLHRDPIGFPVGTIRIHLPIVTHPEVEMWIGGERARWQVGELWYGDFGFPHRLLNPTTDVTRVHLVIDACVTDDLLALFPATFVVGDIYKHRPLVRRQHDLLRKLEGSRWHVPRSLFVGLGAPEDLCFSINGDSVIAKSDGGNVAFVLDPIATKAFAIRGYYPGVTFELSEVDDELSLVHRGCLGFDEDADPESEQTPWELYTTRSTLARL
jgi:hypothetical protein